MGLVQEVYTVTPVITGSGAYSAGQSIGPILSFFVPANFILKSITFVDKDKQSAAIDTVIFVARPATVFADQATFNPSNADALLIQAVLKTVAGDYSVFSANSAGTTRFTDQPIIEPVTLQNEQRTLFVALVCRGTPTYTTTSSLQVSLAGTTEQF